MEGRLESVTKEQWLAKIDADLKGKSRDDFYRESLADATIKPWYHKEDTNHSITIPGRTIDNILLGIILDLDDPHVANKKLLKNLMGGVSAIHVRANQELNPEILLKDIMLDMITSIWEADHTSHIKSHISTSYPTNSCDSYIISPISSNKVIQLTSSPQRLSDFLSQAEGLVTNSVETIFCQVPFDKDYVKSICQVLAIRLLWANLCAAYGSTARLIIEGVVASDVRSDDIHQDLIVLTQVMAAMLSADVDIVCPMSPEDSEEDQRLIRQAFHLLTMEGHLGKVRAPYAGSYALEKISVDMAYNTWTTFVNNL